MACGWRSSKAETFLKSTLKFLNLDSCTVDKEHPLWQYGHDSFEVTMAATKARMTVLRYGMYISHCAGEKKCSQCSLCGGQEETMAHFLLHCLALQQARSTTDHKIKTLLEHFYQPRSEDDLIQAILDPSALTWIPKNLKPNLRE